MGPLYYYFWKNNPTRMAWRGRVVRLVCVGPLNAALIEDAETGARMVTNRRAIRRLKLSKPTKPTKPGLGGLAPGVKRREILSVMGGLMWRDHY
jgi:hypothetical protein